MSSATRSADALINYALDQKLGQEDARYVMASGVGGLLVSLAKQQMRDVRKKWGKDTPGAFVQAYHVIESFAKDELHPNDPDAWLTAQKIGRALAEDRFPGRQALVVTQRDGTAGCLHNHIVVSSVETRSGRSLDSSIVMHARLVEAHERVLEEQGFEQREDLKVAFAEAADRRERGEPSRLRRADARERSELQEYQRYVMWETEDEIAREIGADRKPEPFSAGVLQARIMETLEDPRSVDWATFVEIGRVHRVDIRRRGRSGRGISYGMLRELPDGSLAEPSASDRRRCASLGKRFEMDAVEAVLAQHRKSGEPGRDLNDVQPFATTATMPRITRQGRAPIDPRMLAAVDDAERLGAIESEKLMAEFITRRALESATGTPMTRNINCSPTRSPLDKALSRSTSADESTERASALGEARMPSTAARLASEEIAPQPESLEASSDPRAAGRARARKEIRERRIAYPELFRDDASEATNSRADGLER